MAITQIGDIINPEVLADQIAAQALFGLHS